jgi:hypothetical protein
MNKSENKLDSIQKDVTNTGKRVTMPSKEYSEWSYKIRSCKECKEFFTSCINCEAKFVTLEK